VAIVKSKVSRKVSEVRRKAEEVALFRMVREIESGVWWVEANYD
jgi:hypothetical protein